MAGTAARVLRKRGALPAALTALGVGVVLVVTQVLQVLVTWIGRDPATTLGVFGSLQLNFFVSILPVIVGVFLSLWIIAPIAPELRLGHVITRAILAAGIGCALTFLVAVLLSVAVQFGQAVPNAFAGSITVDARGIFEGIIRSFGSALAQFIGLIPLVVLAGILEWLWLEQHPRQHEVSGLVDDV
jgi:hypothetical protein